MAVNLFVTRRRRRERIFHQSQRRPFNEVLVDFEEDDYRLSRTIIEQLVTGFTETHFSNVCVTRTYPRDAGKYLEIKLN